MRTQHYTNCAADITVAVSDMIMIRKQYCANVAADVAVTVSDKNVHRTPKTFFIFYTVKLIFQDPIQPQIKT